MTNFFSSGIASDRSYLAIRDKDHCQEIRDALEDVWCVYRDHDLNDIDHCEQAKNDFYARFWEMYLGVTLLGMGFCLKKTGGTAPDFVFSHNGQNIHIEATIARPGDGRNAVPAMLTNGIMQKVPVDKMCLRVAGSFIRKSNKLHEYHKLGIVAPEDPYVIAINGFTIRESPYGFEPSLAIKTMFGVGETTCVYNPAENFKLVKKYNPPMPYIENESGAVVEIGYFHRPEYEYVSGILYSESGYTSVLRDDLDFIYIPNPKAKNPIDKNIFRFCKMYTIKWINDTEYNFEVVEPDTGFRLTPE